jgi:hypothetical protein
MAPTAVVVRFSLCNRHVSKLRVKELGGYTILTSVSVTEYLRTKKSNLGLRIINEAIRKPGTDIRRLNLINTKQTLHTIFVKLISILPSFYFLVFQMAASRTVDEICFPIQAIGLV